MPSQLQYGGAGAASGFANAFLGGMKSTEQMAYANAVKNAMFNQRGDLAMQLAQFRADVAMQLAQYRADEANQRQDKSIQARFGLNAMQGGGSSTDDGGSSTDDGGSSTDDAGSFYKPEPFDLLTETGRAHSQAMKDLGMTEKNLQTMGANDISTMGTLEDTANQHLQDRIDQYNANPQNKDNPIDYQPARHYYVGQNDGKVHFAVQGYPAKVSRDQAEDWFANQNAPNEPVAGDFLAQPQMDMGGAPTPVAPPVSAPPSPVAPPVSAPPSTAPIASGIKVGKASPAGMPTKPKYKIISVR